MSKFPKVKIIYVFFTDEQENKIKNNIPLDIDKEIFDVYEKDLTFTNEDIENKLKQCIAYKNECIENKRIPIADISEKALKSLDLVDKE